MNIFGRIGKAISLARRLDQRLDDILMAQGLLQSTLNATKTSTDIRDYEFKVFSQSGEDGILQHLIRSVEIDETTFIEFGVDEMRESNCRYLMMKDNWRGFVMDGSVEAIQKAKSAYYYWKHGVVAISAFVTRDNINELLARSGFGDDVGILSIDIDGNDYYVLDAINSVRPRILICEYNSVFGSVRKISVPYDPAFDRREAHFSHLYWGASLGALAHAAERKGYSLVGSNAVGNNAFFVRNELLSERVRAMSVAEAYVQSRYRESHGRDGLHSLVGGEERLRLIQGLPVYDVERDLVEPL